MQLPQIYEEKLLPDNDTLDAMALFEDVTEEDIIQPYHRKEYLDEDIGIN